MGSEFFFECGKAGSVDGLRSGISFLCLENSLIVCLHCLENSLLVSLHCLEISLTSESTLSRKQSDSLHC